MSRRRDDLSDWSGADDLADWGGEESEAVTKRPWPRVTWPLARDIILFFSGLGGVAHEAIIRTAERPSLLLLFAAMMGLPAFLRRDARSGGE